MKYLYSLLVTIISFLSVSSVSAASTGICTMEYAPVCGSVQVQCIRAPCYPIAQTFGNLCAMKNADATFIKQGECGTMDEGAPVILPESTKTYLQGRYGRFILNISNYNQTVQLDWLRIVDGRIVARLQDMTPSVRVSLEEEMRADRIKQSLIFLQKLVRADIARLFSVASCTPGNIKEVGAAGCNPPSCAITYTCQANGTWNAGTDGPCGVCAQVPDKDAL